MTAQTPAGKCTTRTSTSPARAQQGPLVWKSKLLSDSVWLEDFPTSLPRTNIKQAESLTQREELFQKRTSRPRMESLVLSCHTSKPDLTPNQTAVSTSPRSVTFTQSTWNFLVSRSNSPDRPLPSPKDEVILSFLVLPFSAYKSLPFYPPLWSSFLSARWEAAPFMNH
ncbi:uncharacterized protein LOC118918336 isoform X3 [Manis pentadactyla]|uniref:uncharacterized protein LOC118918336 isoform X3 n=1 Tax=Manis pentadactyla TaxID=143292 RepID=UPI00255CD74D|nr:uncharacterized protein LOC118918336 isoform X3 [Manis pentadactyla]